jgi:hypothetical protein
VRGNAQVRNVTAGGSNCNQRVLRFNFILISPNVSDCTLLNLKS